MFVCLFLHSFERYFKYWWLQGVTPTSTKKDKKEKNQANQATPKQGNLKNQKQDNQKTPKQENQKTPKKGKEENATPQSQKKPTTVGGVVIEELKPGNGAVAKAGKMVRMSVQCDTIW